MPAMLYVGTADGLAIYQPDTAGAWQRVSYAFGGAAVRAVVLLDPGIVVVDAGGVAQQSFDGGATWSAASVSPPEPIGIRVATTKGPIQVVNPRLSGATAYARLPGKAGRLIGAGAGGMMLFHSYDDGIHWTPANMGGPAGNITTIIPAPDNAKAAWAGSDSGVLLRSVDSGQTWRQIAKEPAPILSLAATPTS